MAEPYIVKAGESAAAIFQKYQGQYQGLYEEFVKAIGRVKTGQRIILPTRQQLSAITAPAGIRHTAKTTAANAALLAGQVPRPGIAEIPRPFTSEGSRLRLDETPIRRAPVAGIEQIPEGLGLPGRAAATVAVRKQAKGAPGWPRVPYNPFQIAGPVPTVPAAAIGRSGAGARGAGRLPAGGPTRYEPLTGLQTYQASERIQFPYDRARSAAGARGIPSAAGLAFRLPTGPGFGPAPGTRGVGPGAARLAAAGLPEVGAGLATAVASAPGTRPPSAADTDLARQHIAGGLLGLHLSNWANDPNRRGSDLPDVINDQVAAQLPLAGTEFHGDYKRFLQALEYEWDPTAFGGKGAWLRKDVVTTAGAGGLSTFGLGRAGRPGGGGRGGGGGGGDGGFGFGGEGNLVRWVI